MSEAFPGAGAHIYRNEAGEVTGWDYPSYDHGYDDHDAYADSWAEARAEAEHDAWVDEQIEAGTCCEQGSWHTAYGKGDPYLVRCSLCYEVVPPQVHQGHLARHPEEREYTADWARVPRSANWTRHHIRECEEDLIGELL